MDVLGFDIHFYPNAPILVDVRLLVKDALRGEEVLKHYELKELP